MSSIEFTEPFSFIPPEDRRISITYKPGKVYHGVRAECVRQAVERGVGRVVGNAPQEAEARVEEEVEADGTDDADSWADRLSAQVDQDAASSEAAGS